MLVNGDVQGTALPDSPLRSDDSAFQNALAKALTANSEHSKAWEGDVSFGPGRATASKTEAVETSDGGSSAETATVKLGAAVAAIEARPATDDAQPALATFPQTALAALGGVDTTGVPVRLPERPLGNPNGPQALSADYHPAPPPPPDFSTPSGFRKALDDALLRPLDAVRLHSNILADSKPSIKWPPQFAQSARLGALRPLFLDANALYPASVRRIIPIITVSIEGTEHFSAFNKTLTPHEFLLTNEAFWKWLRIRKVAPGRPLVLDIINPSTAATALAQRLSNLSGSEIVVPRADDPTQWQMLRPIFSAREHVAGIVELSDSGALVLAQGTDRRMIRPEEHLGQVIGAGATKTAFRLYDKTIVVYRDTDQQWNDLPNSMSAQIEATQFLINRGAPYISGIHGATQVFGLDALIMDSFRSSHRSIEAIDDVTNIEDFTNLDDVTYKNRFYRVTDVSLINDNSLTSLREMRQFYKREKIGFDEPQFLIADNGSFFLHDFSKISRSNRRSFVRTLNQLIELVDTVIKRRQSRVPANGPAEQS
jgi:hypothetical protein